MGAGACRSALGGRQERRELPADARVRSGHEKSRSREGRPERASCCLECQRTERMRHPGDSGQTRAERSHSSGAAGHEKSRSRGPTVGARYERRTSLTLRSDIPQLVLRGGWGSGARGTVVAGPSVLLRVRRFRTRTSRAETASRVPPVAVLPQQQSQASTWRSPVSADTGCLQASPRHASSPSRTAKTTTTRPATGSAQVQPKKVLSKRPMRTAAER